VARLLDFAAPPTEVLADTPPATVQPQPTEEVAIPTFLAEVVVTGTLVTVRFREVVPVDLVLLMPIPTMPGDAGYWVLYRADAAGPGPDQPVVVDLAACPRCDDGLRPLTAEPPSQPVLPHVFIKIRWGSHSAT